MGYHNGVNKPTDRKSLPLNVGLSTEPGNNDIDAVSDWTDDTEDEEAAMDSDLSIESVSTTPNSTKRGKVSKKVKAVSKRDTLESSRKTRLQLDRVHELLNKKMNNAERSVSSIFEDMNHSIQKLQEQFESISRGAKDNTLNVTNEIKGIHQAFTSIQNDLKKLSDIKIDCKDMHTDITHLQKDIDGSIQKHTEDIINKNSDQIESVHSSVTQALKGHEIGLTKMEAALKLYMDESIRKYTDHSMRAFIKTSLREETKHIETKVNQMFIDHSLHGFIENSLKNQTGFIEYKMNQMPTTYSMREFIENSLEDQKTMLQPNVDQKTCDTNADILKSLNTVEESTSSILLDINEVKHNVKTLKLASVNTNTGPKLESKFAPDSIKEDKQSQNDQLRNDHYKEESHDHPKKAWIFKDKILVSNFVGFCDKIEGRDRYNSPNLYSVVKCLPSIKRSSMFWFNKVLKTLLEVYDLETVIQYKMCELELKLPPSTFLQFQLAGTIIAEKIGKPILDEFPYFDGSLGTREQDFITVVRLFKQYYQKRSINFRLSNVVSMPVRGESETFEDFFPKCLTYVESTKLNPAHDAEFFTELYITVCKGHRANYPDVHSQLFRLGRRNMPDSVETPIQVYDWIVNRVTSVLATRESPTGKKNGDNKSQSAKTGKNKKAKNF